MTATITDFETLLEQGRNAMGPVVELGELTAKTVEAFARQQFDVAGDYVDFGLQQAELFGKVREPSDLNDVLADQARLATELADKVKGRAGAFAKTATEAQKAYAAWLTTAFKVPGVNAA